MNVYMTHICIQAGILDNHNLDMGDRPLAFNIPSLGSRGFVSRGLVLLKRGPVGVDS